MKSITKFFRFGVTVEPETDETAELAHIELAAAGAETWIEAARSGTFKPRRGPKTLSLTKAHLAGIASNFDSKGFHKLTIGHDPIIPSTPDYGDVTKARYDARRDRLEFAVVPTESMVEKNKKGEYHTPSMELEKLDDGSYSLGHLTVLGAHPPAIKDLARIQLAAGKEETIFLSCTAEDAVEDDPEDDDAAQLAQIDLAAYSMDERKAMAKKGQAMSDGSFPIADMADMVNAIHALGRASDPAAAKAHIIKRAKEMKLTDSLPADWPGSTKKVAAAASAEEDEMAEEKKLELAEARIKELEADRARFIDSDVEKFVAETGIKKFRLDVLKGGDVKRVLLAAARLDPAAGKIMLASADGKSEVEGSLYDGLKKIFLSMPDKLTTAEQEEAATAARAAGEGAGDVPDNLKRFDLDKRYPQARFAKSEKHDKVVAYLAAHPDEAKGENAYARAIEKIG